MGKTKLDQTYIFKIGIKMRFFWCSYWYQKFHFLDFWLLLSRVAPYYSSLPRIVWKENNSVFRGSWHYYSFAEVRLKIGKGLYFFSGPLPPLSSFIFPLVFTCFRFIVVLSLSSSFVSWVMVVVYMFYRSYSCVIFKLYSIIERLRTPSIVY